MRTFVSLLLASAPAAAAIGQTTWYVDVAGTPPGAGTLASPYVSIQFAHDQASTVTGDTLSVAAGLYVENLTIGKRVRIVAPAGPDATTLRAAAPGDLILCSADDEFPFATMRGFTLDGSAFPAGTGIHVDNSSFAVFQLERSVVRDFAAGRAVSLGSNGYLDAHQATIARNAVGVRVEPAISNGVATLRGCIARGNGIELSGTEIGYDPSYCNIDPNLSSLGDNNISADPQFWNALSGDLHLRPTSPCIDAAGSGFPLDPDGSAADIGAHAFDPSYGWSSYCTSGVTSSGCTPTISASGAASASASSGFTLTVTGVEGAKDGHLFYGLSGPHAAPWGSSSHFLCVKAPSQRTGTQNSGGTAGVCDGVVSLDWCAYVATHPTALGAPFSAGTSVWAQLYFRDPPGPKTTALSNALTFTVIP